jgi:capsular exopolysaccharide synthesis family protein
MEDETGFVDDSIDSSESASVQKQFAEYWAVIVARWRLIALCLFLALAVAALYSLLAKPMYRATAIVDVEPERFNPLDIGFTPPAYYNVGPEFLATQTRLMQTREIVLRAVRQLNLAENKQFNPPPTSLIQRAKKRTAEDEEARIAGAVKKAIDAKPVRQVGVTTRDTNLVELSAIAPTPALAAAIANAIADAYIGWNLESKYGLAGRASGYLGAQIEETKRDLDEKAQQLLAYGKEKDIVSNDPQATIYYQRQELNYDAAVADRVAKEARYHDVENAPPESVADTLSNGLVSQLRAEQAKLERDYAEKLSVFKPDWPAMRQLKAQIDNGREHLAAVSAETVAKARETAKNDYLNALRREESLRATIKTQKNESMKFNADVINYNTLKLEVDTKRALLDTLLRRQAEVEVMSRLGRDRDSNIRVAEPARPPDKPFRPSYLINGLFALLIGGGLGIGLAFTLEYFDSSLRSAEQVERYLHLPVLGVIPALGAGAGKGYAYPDGRKRRSKNGIQSSEDGAIELMPHRSPRARIAERYRAFRTALLLSRAGGLKSIVVTSSFSREGKTATAANLAVVLGQLGKRVLLVDADLHRPRLHEIFRVSNRVGLVSILAENASPETVIVNTGIPGVSLVPSGPASPNPSGLLSSEAMTQFLLFARQSFDYVVLDAPPVAAVADALVLGHQTDGIVLCVQGGKTPREHVAHVRDRIARANVRILGVLLSNLTEDASGYRSLDYDQVYYDENARAGDRPKAASGAGNA